MTRRGLLQALPALSHFYGIHPWHIEPDPPILTVDEIAEYLFQYPKQQKDATDGL